MDAKTTYKLIVLFVLLNVQYSFGQQLVYSRDNSGTDLWWNDTNKPWYYFTWQNDQNRPDAWPVDIRNSVFIGHNVNPVMRVNGAVFGIGSLTFQNSATVARTFNAIDGGGLGLTIGLYNDSPAHHTFNIPIRLDAATVQIAANTSHLTLAASTINLQSNTAQFAGASNINVVSAISGTGNITKSGAGTLTLSGTNTFTGSATVSVGTIAVSGAMASTSYTINGGTLRLSAANILPDAATVTLSSGTFSVNENETINNLNISGGMVSVAAGKILTVNGTLTLSDQAQLSLGAGAAIRYGNSGALVYNLGSNSVTPSAEWPSSFAPASVTLNSGTVTLSGNTTMAGSLTLNGGTLDMGTHTLDRATSGGTLTVANGATLKIGGTNTLPASYATHIIGNTSTIEYRGAAQSIGALHSGQQYGNLVLSGSGTKSMNGDLAVTNNLTMQGTAEVTVASGTNLTVGNSVTLSNSLHTIAEGEEELYSGLAGDEVIVGAKLVIENNAGLIQVNDVNNTGIITVKEQSAPMFRLDYALWSSPVAAETLIGFSPATLTNRFYHYNPETDAYSAAGLNGGDVPFDEGRSYLIRVANTHPSFESNPVPTSWQGSFVGVPNNGNVNVSVTPRNTSMGIKGFNAVGNPYPSPINVSEFFERNANNLVNGSSLFFWRKKNSAGSSSYVSLTLSGLIVQSDNNWGDTSDDEFANLGDNQNWVLNPGQGFIVQAASGTIAFDNQMRVAKNHDYQFRTAQDGTATSSRLWLNLKNEAGDFSQSMIAYTPNTTLDIDYAWDGKAMTDGPITIYSLVGESKLGIQARLPFDVADEVPLGYMGETAGSYTIALDHADGVFAQGQDIYLRDNLLNITHDLNEGPYAFVAEAGTNDGRFDVVYAQALGAGAAVWNADSTIIYKDGNSISINSGTVGMTAVSVYDVRGRLLYSESGMSTTQTVISGLQPQQQMLIVQVTTPEGKVSRKLIY